ncbi:hypothetical protein TRSC58_07349 [Trypanosoma rangeli SC58]|uniref:Transmembrane protein n=1 Tax=Trypanosoma rangeli SC58 TaxID=429131 RepID=A0A061ISZ9_TRYRA|nr:hypothetical protein TRSC58_07349 [Trypanosoma rangeli SC58]
MSGDCSETAKAGGKGLGGLRKERVSSLFLFSPLFFFERTYYRPIAIIIILVSFLCAFARVLRPLLLLLPSLPSPPVTTKKRQ